MDGGESAWTRPLDFIKVKNKSGAEDTHYSILYEGLPDEYRRLAKETLNETDENRRNGMKKLRIFAEKENLTCPDDDLLLVLRACKYNMKKSEKKLKKFVVLRKQLMMLVANLDEKKWNLIMDDMCFGVLPYRDKLGRMILYSKPNLRLDLYDIEDTDVVVSVLLFYFISMFPLTSLTGICYIGECDSDNLYIFYAIFNNFRKTYLNLFLDAPLRLSRVDIVNEFVLIRFFFNVVRPLLPEKLKRRVTFHGKGYESVKKAYHPDILPEDFGGNMGPISDKFYREKLYHYLQKLRAECIDTKPLEA